MRPQGAASKPRLEEMATLASLCSDWATGRAQLMLKMGIRRHIGQRIFAATAMAFLTSLVLVPKGNASVEQDLIATMRAMNAALLRIQAFVDGKDVQEKAVDDAVQLVVLAKSIPQKFPPGTELAELPSKFDAGPTTWDDFEQFLDAQKRLVIETDKLLFAVKTGDKAAVAEQVAGTRIKACGNCHNRFRD